MCITGGDVSGNGRYTAGMRRFPGFTIIELIIVIGIIGVLSSVVFVILRNPTERAEAKKTLHGVAQIVRLIEQYRGSGYSSDEIADELAKLDIPIGEKVAASVPFLIDLRDSEKSSNFCNPTSGSEGTAYTYLKKLNGNSSTGIYTGTSGSRMTVTDNADRTILCKNNSGATNGYFAVAAKITDTIWTCGAYDDRGEARYFVIDTGTARKLKINCFISGGTFTKESNGFFASLAGEYDPD